MVCLPLHFFLHLANVLCVCCYFSFGCTALFLIGGRTKSVKPIAFYIRDGDIVIMSSECRLSYHAVPRIFTNTYSAHILGPAEKDIKTAEESMLTSDNMRRDNVSNVVSADTLIKSSQDCQEVYADSSTYEVSTRANDADALICDGYLCSSRININVRQVFARWRRWWFTHILWSSEICEISF